MKSCTRPRLRTVGLHYAYWIRLFLGANDGKNSLNDLFGHGLFLHKSEVIAQGLSEEPKGNSMKYAKQGPREFVPFEYTEVTLKNIKCACKVHYWQNLTVCATSSPAHLFAIRGRRKRGPGTLQTRDQNLPKCELNTLKYLPKLYFLLKVATNNIKIKIT